jgi:hypothetical protein
MKRFKTVTGVIQFSIAAGDANGGDLVVIDFTKESQVMKIKSAQGAFMSITHGGTTDPVLNPTFGMVLKSASPFGDQTGAPTSGAYYMPITESQAKYEGVTFNRNVQLQVVAYAALSAILPNQQQFQFSYIIEFEYY